MIVYPGKQVLVRLPNIPVLDEKGEPVLQAVRDEKGKAKVDADKNPVMEPVFDPAYLDRDRFAIVTRVYKTRDGLAERASVNLAVTLDAEDPETERARKDGFGLVVPLVDPREGKGPGEFRVLRHPQE